MAKTYHSATLTLKAGTPEGIDQEIANKIYMACYSDVNVNTTKLRTTISFSGWFRGFDLEVAIAPYLQYLMDACWFIDCDETDEPEYLAIRNGELYTCGATPNNRWESLPLETA